MKRVSQWLIVILFTALLLGVWSAQTVHSAPAQEGIAASPTPVPASMRLMPAWQDAFISSDAADDNFGAATELRAQWISGGEVETIILIKFDLTDFPSRTEVQNAYLSLVLTDLDSAAATTMTAHEITQPWTEMSVTWENRPPIAPEPVASVRLADTPDRAFYWDITPLLRLWIENPAANHGLALRIRSDDPETIAIFGSRESTATPRLALTYTAPPIELTTPTPTPLPPHQEITLPISDTAYLRWEREENRDKVWPDPGDIRLSADSQRLIQERRLFKFDLSAIPAGAKVYQARLNLHLQGGDNPDAIAIRANMMEMPWSAATATWANAAWAANRESDAPRGWIRTPLSESKWIDIGVTRIVQRWVEGRSPNYGLQLSGPDHMESTWSRVFSGPDEPDFAPNLVVLYGMEGERTEQPRGGKSSNALPSPKEKNLCEHGTLQLLAPQNRREWAKIIESTVISGVVEGGDISHEEIPSTHDEHDFIFHVKKNHYNAWAMGGANADEMEIEWEHPQWPKWAWPITGDDIVVFGPLVYDCGHDVDAGGKTEIHPPRGVATIRKHVAADITAHGGLGVALVNRADIYFTSRRTRAYCGGWCEPSAQWPVYTPLGDRNYQFDLYPPQNRATGTKLIWWREDHPDPFGAAVTPTVKVVGAGSNQHLHVTLPYKGRKGKLHTASSLYVGWSRTMDPPLRKFKVQVHGIDIIDNADVSDGEWYVWININGQWFDLRDYIPSDKTHGLGDAKDAYYATNLKDLVAYVIIPNTEDASIRIKARGFESDWMDNLYGSPNAVPKLSKKMFGHAIATGFVSLAGYLPLIDNNDEIQMFDWAFKKKDNFMAGVPPRDYPATGQQDGQYRLRISVQEQTDLFQYQWIEAGVADPDLKAGGVTLDGSCDHNEYSASQIITFTLSSGAMDRVTVRAAYDDAHLYICFEGIPDKNFMQESQQAVIYLDPTTPSLPKIYPGWPGHSDDLRIAFQMKPKQRTTAYFFYPPTGWYTQQAPPGLIDAQTSLTAYNRRDVEFRIDKSLIGRGPWSTIAEEDLLLRGIGAMFAIERPAGDARRGAWPETALPNRAEEWGRMVFLPACPIALQATRIGKILDMEDPRESGTITIGGGEYAISKVGDQAKVQIDYQVLFDHPRCNLKTGKLTAAWPTELKAIQWKPGGAHTNNAITWSLPSTLRQGTYDVTLQQMKACWGGENPDPYQYASGTLDAFFNSAYVPHLNKTASTPICKSHGTFPPELKMWPDQWPRGMIPPWIYLHDPLRQGDPAQISFDVHNEGDAPRRIMVKTMLTQAGVSTGANAANLDFSKAAGVWYAAPPHSTITIQLPVMQPSARMQARGEAGMTAVAVEVSQPDGGGPPQTAVRQIVPYLQLQPGQESVFTTMAWNTLSEPEELNLGVTVNCSGWRAWVEPERLPVMAPGESASVQVHLVPPEDQPLGSGCPIDVSAWSDAGELAGTQRFLDLPPLQFSADRHFFAPPELQLEPKQPQEGEPARVCATIYNQSDEMRPATVQFARSDRLSTVPAFTPFAEMVIQASAKGPTRICTPPFAWSGDRSFRATLLQEGYQPQAVIRSVGQLQFDEGAPQPFSLEVRNPLDAAQVISLTHRVVGLPGWQAETPAAVTLGPGASRMIDVRVTRPHRAQALTLGPPPGDAGYVDVWANTSDGRIIGGARLQVWQGPIRRMYLPLTTH